MGWAEVNEKIDFDFIIYGGLSVAYIYRTLAWDSEDPFWSSSSTSQQFDLEEDIARLWASVSYL